VPLGLIRGIELPIYDRFDPAAEVPFPAGYVLAPPFEAIADHLRLHGVRIEHTDSDWTGPVETWTPTSREVLDRPWSGGVQLVLETERRREERTFPAGSLVVRTAQPLGVLAVHLLEPKAPDSVISWRIAGFEPEIGTPLPYFRLPEETPPTRGR
jgi:hypothetical protein